MGEHTKGPWAWYENPSGGCRVQTLNVGIADVLSRAGVPHPVQESCAANARLIAAAPELLEALERVGKLDAHGCLTRDCLHKTGRECAEELATVLAEMIDRARYAIEKARGEG